MDYLNELEKLITITNEHAAQIGLKIATHGIGYSLPVQVGMKADFANTCRTGEVKEIEKMLRDKVREILKDFCKEYEMQLFENDGKDHSTELRNALDIIDTMGELLDYDTLRRLLEPLRNAENEFLLVRRVVENKMWVPEETKQIFDDMLGLANTNGAFEEYTIAMGSIKEVQNVERPISLNIILQNASNGTYIVEPEYSYSFICLDDWMKQVKNAYSIIQKVKE